EDNDASDHDAKVASDRVVLHAKVLFRVLFHSNVTHICRRIRHRLAAEIRANVLVHLRRLIPRRQLVAIRENKRNHDGQGELHRRDRVQPLVARGDGVRRRTEAHKQDEDRIHQNADNSSHFFARKRVGEHHAHVDLHEDRKRQDQPEQDGGDEALESHERVEDHSEDQRTHEAVGNLSQRRTHKVPERIIRLRCTFAVERGTFRARKR
ncbi:hypothetical protein F442_23130, partial [Phytophthora nicotianae P10297]